MHNLRKKVLCILHLPPPIHGAAMVGKYIRESELINKEFEIDYINLSTSTQLTEIGKGGVKKLIILIKLQYSVVKLLFNKRYDLCYMTLTARGPGFYKDILIVSLLKLFGRKILFHFHNKGIAQTSNSFLNQLLYRFAFQNTQSVLLSQYLYPDLKPYVAEKNVFYCPNGMPVQSITGQEIKKENPIFNLLFLSNMMEAKGVFILLEACQHLKKRGINFECHLIGAWADITKDDFDRKISKYNLGGTVFGHGNKYGEEKLAFLSSADAFVHPTLNDCFPLVLIEALQAGLPVISTPEGGIPDIVIDGETGFLVPQQNAEALAEKIELLIKEPEIGKKMGAIGKERYEELFTLEKFENRLCKILNQAIAG